MTSNKLILSYVVAGICLEFQSAPPLPNAPFTYSLDQVRLTALKEEWYRLKEIGAIRHYQGKDAVFSPVFIIPKKDSGKWRVIFDLHCLNISINKIHFKMEGLPDIRDLLRKGDWIFSVDIKDAYHGARPLA